MATEARTAASGKGEEPVYELALSMIPGLGPGAMRHLVETFGSAEAVLKASGEELTGRAALTEKAAEKVCRSELLARAEAEGDFVREYGLRVLAFDSGAYPLNLKENCADAPFLLYAEGGMDFNAGREKWVAVVGTRRATPYGARTCERIVRELADRYPGTVIVSGLAYGIDVTAHRAALKYGLKTVAVLAHGLEKIYPSSHRETAREIVRQGGALVTEFPSRTVTVKSHFLQRNRIMAGLTRATLVMESAARGGSLVTADIADSYGREVFAVPGRLDEPSFEGTNRLIKTNKARLLQTADDIGYYLGWQMPGRDRPAPVRPGLSPEEETVLSCFEGDAPLTFEEVAERLHASFYQASCVLNGLESKGLVSSVPGQMYVKN